MLGHYLLTLYRSLSRHKLYAAINVLGLAVGIAVFLVLALDVRFEASFERWIPGADKIYLIRATRSIPGQSAETSSYTMGGLLDQLRADFPGEVSGTRIWTQVGTVRQHGLSTSERVSVVDPQFFTIFHLPFVDGDARSALAHPSDVILSRSKAKTFFGDQNPLNKTIDLSISGQLYSFRVAGVIRDDPDNTDFQFGILVPLSFQMTSAAADPHWTNWGSSEVNTYVNFPNASQVEALNSRLDAFTDQRARADFQMPDAHRWLRLRAIPLTSVHLSDSKDRNVLALLGAVGMLTLLLAAVNYVNSATARAGMRAREVAVRKVMGATARQLMTQFMTEATVSVALAALCGVILAWLALPFINEASGLSLKLSLFGTESVLPFLIAVVVVVGIGAGSYPAIVLSRYRAAAVLASAKTPGGGRAGSRVRGVLVAAQFTIAITFGVGTAIILSEGAHLRRADLGFRRESLLIVRSLKDPDVSAAQRSAVLSLWQAARGVVGVTSADIAPGIDDSTTASSIKQPGVVGEGPNLNRVTTGSDFFQVLGSRLLAGRLLDRRYASDDLRLISTASTAEEKAAALNRNYSIVLSENAVKAEGFRHPQDAIGKTLVEGVEGGGVRTRTVVGVISDLRLRSPRKAVPPTYYMLNTGRIAGEVALIRYAGLTNEVAEQIARAEWRRVTPGVPFRAQTAEAGLEAYYKPDDQRGRLFTIGALLAMVIGCVGLYGLAAFSTARRVKEIGIRKALGASSRDILVLLLRQFITPVLWANLAAWPLAFFAMRAWLSGFDQRIALGPQYFLGVSLVTILVAAATVAGQAWRVARAEPARALRHE